MSVDKLKEREKNVEYFDDFLRIVGDKKYKHDHQVSISTTFYVRIFRTNFCRQAKRN